MKYCFLVLICLLGISSTGYSINDTLQIEAELTDTINNEYTGNHSFTKSNFNKGMIISPLELIQGKIPGLLISSNSGAPGKTFTIKDKGVYSLSSHNNLLFYIDNVPVDPNLMCINPNDVESITYIDDPSVARKHSNQASHGILLITTKKESEKFSVNYTNNFSMSTITGKVDVFSADEFRTLISEQFADNQDILDLPLDYNTDWQDEIYKTAYGQDHYLNISGGLKKLPYKISVGKTDLDGVLRSSNLNRTTTQFFFEPSLFKNHLKVTLDFKGSFHKDRIANEDAIRTAVHYDPTRPLYRFGDYSTYLTNDMAPENPVAVLDYTKHTSDIDAWNKNIRLDYRFHFLTDLRFIFNYGKTDYEENTSITRDPFIEYARYPAEENSKLTYTNTFTDAMFSYSKKIKPLKTYVDFQLGTSRQEFKTSEDYSALYPDTEYKTIKSSSERSINSYFSQLHFMFLKKYTLNAMISQNIDSRYSKDNKTYYAKAISLAWNIKNEEFIKNKEVISNLSLQFKYSQIPNSEINSGYTFMPNYLLGNQNTSYSLTGYDPNFKPETITNISANLSIGLLKRIYANINFYFRETSDLLVEIPVAMGSNFTDRLVTNNGIIHNKGIELSLHSLLVNKNNFTWDIDFNFTYNKNEIIKIYSEDNPAFTGFEIGDIGYGNSIQVLSEGYPANSFFVYEQIYDVNGNPIEDAFVDQNNDGVIDHADKKYYKTSDPNILLGIGSSLSYKNWQLSFFGRASIGNYVYNNIDSWSSYDQIFWEGYLSNLSKSVEQTQFESAQLFSDYYVENASFFRMDYISLGYNFDKILNNTLKIRLEGTVQNAFVITSYSGVDPEVASGIDSYAYPRPRIYSLGLNISF
jgi:iron complex outermembrane receptor protein